MEYNIAQVVALKYIIGWLQVQIMDTKGERERETGRGRERDVHVLLAAAII